MSYELLKSDIRKILLKVISSFIIYIFYVVIFMDRHNRIINAFKNSKVFIFIDGFSRSKNVVKY